ncbi:MULTISPECIES: endopeptidase La [Cobetia]|jgi:ATP-dependent Lon protease|uniref:Lon protease n=2 Tax=Cobetia TaxID=204286 RepID=A0AAP4WWH5_9GAMM|nr:MULTISPECIES: endopeptidase La [Cobetia]MBR9755710.1 endopeptidase La [Gammaproteobacteria bacterium]TCJ26718.1 endopeptidase La [Halomonas sp. GDM18]KGA03295.1 DNA-binding protein [Cobetia amphilecti]MBE2167210.1 endopeptidase La [Cobetia sp. 2AS1]MBS4153382.1 endopeptidase La [Cobetia sp. MC34]
MEQNEDQTLTLPLLPLRDVVVYPQMVIPLFVGREKSIQALEVAMEGDKKILLAAQREASQDDPTAEDLFAIGTVADIMQLLKLPDGTVKVLIEGSSRADIQAIRLHDDGHSIADVALRDSQPLSEREQETLVRVLLNQFEQYVKLSKKVPNEVLGSLQGIEDPSRLVDTISAHLSLGINDKQALLEMDKVRDRIEHLMTLIEAEIDLLQVEKRIRTRVKEQMEKSQREYYLNEQMKAIQKEMGELDDVPNEVEQYERRIKDAGMPKEAEEKATQELNKLKMMGPTSAEATVVRTYLDWLCDVPWKKRTRVRHDIDHAAKVLDEDHYGLDEVKERILEYLAVQKRVKKLKGPVLCLVGPPGVGKTSLGKSIARATNRQYTRMALGGVRDESEIRGHRRTYIGALPGKIIQRMAKTGVKNPLVLLDEIDKLGMDHRGDPASALLEVLDPEQNDKFADHYLELDYDLSETLFICTSNSMNIPGPLRDRMEIIRLPGYTEDEKLAIAMRYLAPKQLKANGLKPGELTFSEASVLELIRYYSREAGVRELERQLAKVCRKIVRERVVAEAKEGALSSMHLEAEQVERYAGVRKYSFGLADAEDQIGRVTGLAWTSVGGELLTIESVVTPGKGRVSKTGSLGDVMKESVSAAHTVVRARAEAFGIEAERFEKEDLHIHVPEGATPKDGPSAGAAMVTAMVSAYCGRPVRCDVAMTGEVNLRGEVMPIGGLKEKLLAARRGGIKLVLIPEENRRDLKEVPDTIKDALDIRPVRWIDEVLEVALAEKSTAEKDDSRSDDASGRQTMISTH